MTIERRVILIDATAFCYRAFYAIRHLASSSGQPTNAVFGFVRMFQKLLKQYQPGYVGVCFDVSAPTFRHEKFADYKAQRQAMPDSLASQLPLIKDIVRAWGMTVCEQPGFEADDVIATLAAKAAAEGFRVTVVSSDKDLLQLVDAHTELVNPMEKNGAYGQEEVRAKLGVNPSQVADLIALAGDSADNIPSIKGVSAKKAVELLQSWGSVEAVLAHAAELKPAKVAAAVQEQAGQLRLNRELSAVRRDVSLQVDIPGLAVKAADQQRLEELFRGLDLRSFLKDLPGSDVEKAGIQEAAVAVEELDDQRVATLFSAASRLCCLPAREEGMLLLNLPGAAQVYRCSAAGTALRGLLSSSGVVKITHDLKKLSGSLPETALAAPFFDTMLAAYLVNPGRSSYRLSDVAWEYLKAAASDDLPPEAGCAFLARLQPLLQEQLSAAGLENVFTDLEMPLALVLSRMERDGIAIDVQRLNQLSKELEQKLAVLIRDIYGVSGCEFNINSPKQLSEVLFVKLGLPVVKRTKTGASTDEEVLRTLATKHELPAKLLEYRQLTKLKSTYIDALPQLADSRSRVHSTFNQAGTETGRLSSSNPNLQNLPIRTELGRQIRQAVVACAGQLLLSCDYSQIELRILAHLSGDQQLCQAFGEGADIHRRTAALLHGVDESSVTEEMRSTAKRVNFGIVYGLSAFGLARDLALPQEAAQRFIDAYFLRYPGVKVYIERQISLARQQGFVTTMLGRRRYLPEINDRNQAVRQFAERQAVNTPIQGSASDMIKLAMVRIAEDIRSARVQARMVLQIHDELLFEVPEKSAAAAAQSLRAGMQDVLELAVPVVVDCAVGPNWSQMEKL